jgi:hypothetical protein
VQLCLNGSKYAGKPKYGAIGAAEYLKALECLPAIEAALPKEIDWYIRCALAEALDAIDQESSKTLVVAQLEKEKDLYVATNLARYLSRHPVPGTKEMLTKKMDYFDKIRFSKDSTALLTVIELKGASASLKILEEAQ